VRFTWNAHWSLDLHIPYTIREENENKPKASEGVGCDGNTKDNNIILCLYISYLPIRNARIVIIIRLHGAINNEGLLLLLLFIIYFPATTGERVRVGRLGIIQ